MTTTTRYTHVSLWLDSTSEETPHWIVSLEDGLASATVAVFAEHDYRSAHAHAKAVAKERGLQLETLAK